MNFCGITDILWSKSDLKILDCSDPPARVSLFPFPNIDTDAEIYIHMYSKEKKKINFPKKMELWSIFLSK